MSSIVAAYAPWMLNVYQYENVAVYPWVQGYKYNRVQRASVDVLRHRHARAEAAGRAVTAYRVGVALALLACAALATAAAPSRARPTGQGVARQHGRRGGGLRSAGCRRHVLLHGRLGHLRSAVRVRLLRRRAHRAAHRGVDAGHLRRRAHVDDPLEAGHPLRGRSAFKGAARELVAQDYVYSWKRLLDRAVRSPNAEILADRIDGARAAIDAARTTGRFDYDAPLRGLRARDRYTIELRLHQPDYTLLPYLTFDGLSAVAREVIEAHADASGRAMDHPVGTGAFRLAEWRRGQKIVLVANPAYREDYFPDPPSGADDGALALARSMTGRRLPMVGRVELSIIEPPQPQLLAFDSGALDILDMPFELARKVIDPSGRLLPAYQGQGLTVQRVVDQYLGYLYFNMEDTVVGGEAPERVALRRAILMAYDVAQEIDVVRNGQGLPATQPIPPDVDGHVQGLDVRPPHDPAGARALLDKFGYRDRNGDGWRERPDGTSLSIRIGTTPEDRERDNLVRKNLQAIGVRLEFVNRKWADLLKMAREGQLQMWMVGNFATSADAIMLTLYGPNAGNNNLARFRNAEFDALYRQSKRTRDDAERARIYERMARIVGAYNPWGLRVYAIRTALVRPWVHGYLRNPHLLQAWRYVDVDPGPHAVALR
jgi:ABC-type transport system substrate-binding protein